MKALVLTEYNHLEMEDVPTPQISDNEVLIRVKACSICGSDVHGYDGSSGRRIPPVIMGHEAAGIIEETGSAVMKFKKGDRVTFNSSLYCGDCFYCRRGEQNMCESGKVFGVACADYKLDGAMAEYVKIPEHVLYPVPDNVTFEQAALAEPLSIALHAVGRAAIKINDTAVVFGVGTIGIMMLKLLKISSANRIIAVDIDDSKLDNAKKLGADLVLNSKNCNVPEEILAYTNGRGADLCFEAGGIPSTTNMCLDCLRKNGTAVLVGNVTPEFNLAISKAVFKELRIIGSYACTTEYATSLDLIASGKIEVDDVVSKAAPLEEGNEWFHKLHDEPAGLVKVILLP